MGPRLLFFIGYYLCFLKILNKLFNNICYKLATDLGYTYTCQPVNEGYEILKRKFNLYFDFYYRRLKTILVNPELWIIFILLLLLFSFLRFMYLFCFIFLCLLLVKDLLFYRFSNQKELRPKTYGNLYFIECDMNNHQHISLKNAILLIYNLTFRDAQVGAFKFTYYILKYASKPFMVPFTWVSLVVIICTLVIWFKKFSYIVPLIAFCKA